MYNLFNIDLSTVSKQWVYDNNDVLIRILHDRVREDLEPSWLNSEENECEGSQESSYNDLLVRHCAKIVGEMFGFEVGLYNSDGKLTMIEYFLEYKNFCFSTEFSWINIGGGPEAIIGQDYRMVKLARQKRAEFTMQYNLRERVGSWLEDEIKNTDDSEIISRCFMEMGEIMDYLLDVVYCRALRQSIHMS